MMHCASEMATNVEGVANVEVAANLELIAEQARERDGVKGWRH